MKCILFNGWGVNEGNICLYVVYDDPIDPTPLVNYHNFEQDGKHISLYITVANIGKKQRVNMFESIDELLSLLKDAGSSYIEFESEVSINELNSIDYLMKIYPEFFV